VGGRLPVLESLAHGPLMRALVACAMIQGSHAVYYAFATLHWQALGYSELVIGAFWAEGVVAEIVLFAFGTRIVARIGARKLIVLAGLACGARWCATAFAEDATAIAAAQVLHAFTFGAAHLGAMAFIGRYVAPSLSATAQSLYSGMVWGVGLALMLLASGWLYGWISGYAFLAMAAAGLAGAAVAWPLKGRRAAPASPER
jgi:PPP family 3-phenylpropionic acid transporter